MTDQQHSNALSGTVSGAVVQARSIGNLTFQLPAVKTPVPWQFPMPPRGFATRDDELETLARWQREDTARPLLVVISGPAGVGKTSLALRWLHGLRDEYPDGQVFVELSEATTPVTPDEALEWMLRSLGTLNENMPEGRTQRQALFRTLTAGRRLTVLLDDALSAAQVRPLIPAGGHSVVVTSRWRLSRLAMDGAQVLEVDTLDTTASVHLLETLVGPERIAAEPDAATELASLCGGLPLALSIVGARLAARPRRSVAREVDQLRAEHDRLDALTLEEDISVTAVQDSAYRALHPDAQAIYRLIGLHPGPELRIDVLVAISRWPRHRVQSAVDQAVEANILTETEENRLRCHDLTHLHARDVALRDDPDPAATRRRIIEYYLDQVIAADILIHPHRLALGPRYSDPTPHAAFGDREGALGWMHTEHRTVRTAVRAAFEAGHHDLVWQCCEGLWGFFLHTRGYVEFIELHEFGRQSAVLCAETRAEARLCSQQGFAHAKLGEYEQAIALNTRALHLAEQAGDTQATATALSQLGRATRGQKDLPTALEYFRRARDLQHEIGRTRGVALCTRRIGAILAQLGHTDEALAELRTAAVMMEQLGDQTQHARALMEIGTTRLGAGEPDQALSPLQEALAMMREFGSPYYQAEILGHLGATTHALGDFDTARAYYREAIDLYTQVGDPKSALLQQRLDTSPQHE